MIARNVGMRFTMLSVVALAACAAPRPADDADSGRADSGATATGGGAGGATPAPAATDTTAAQGGVAIELDRTTYAPGATVNLRIVNRSGAGLGYNACTRAVERRDGGTWVVVPEPDRVCTMELRLLGAGETANERTDLPARLAAGEYRLAIRFSREEQPAPGPGTPAAGPIRATSAPFAVR